MPRKTISEVISAAAATPRATLELDPKVAADEDANELYEGEEGQPANRRFSLPDTDSVKAAGGGAVLASMALATSHPVAGAVIGAVAFGATCVAESILRQEGQK